MKTPISWTTGRRNEVEFLDAEGAPVSPDDLVAAINCSAAFMLGKALTRIVEEGRSPFCREVAERALRSAP